MLGIVSDAGFVPESETKFVFLERKHTLIMKHDKCVWGRGSRGVGRTPAG